MNEYLQDNRLKIDIAYGCHAFIGLFHGIITVALLIDFNLGQAAGMFIGLNLFIVALVAALVTIYLSIRLWRHRPFLLLIALALIPLLLNKPIRSMTGLKEDVLYLGYDIAAVAFSMLWFFRTRNRLPGAEQKAISGSKPSRRVCDLVYGSFLISGIVSGWMALAAILPWPETESGLKDTALSILLGMSVGLVLPAVIFLTVGLIFSIRYFRHLPFALLSLTAILYVVTSVLNLGPESIRSISGLPFFALSICLALLWFLVNRRKPAHEKPLRGGV